MSETRYSASVLNGQNGDESSKNTRSAMTRQSEIVDDLLLLLLFTSYIKGNFDKHHSGILRFLRMMRVGENKCNENVEIK